VILQDSTLIRASPERVFEFFDRMDENYTRWHPDHILFRWEQGHGVHGGNVFYFEETIAGEHQKKRVFFTRVERGRYMEFAPTSRLFRLFLPRLSFGVEPQGEAVRFTAEIVIRLGPLSTKMHERELAAVRRHMSEEGENLKRLLEGAGATDGHAQPQPAATESGIL
jgi:hypothetical protein